MIDVAIVEDDPMVLDVNRGFLEKLPVFKYQGSAQTGKEALTMLKQKKVDLVLLDVYLPDISGVEVLHEIRKADIPTDIITITAARDARTVHQLFRLGAVDYLVKPFRFDRFKLALENYGKMWTKLQNAQSISQEDIDEWNEQSEVTDIEALPKGLSELTLRQIVMALFDQSEPITAEQLAVYLGMARVTVRRYLEHLEKQDKIKVHAEYGRVGRPTHYYSV